MIGGGNVKINMDSISDKIKSYSNSSEGKEKIKRTIDISTINEATQELVNMIKDNLPLSIRDNVKIICSDPDEVNGIWRVEINFDAESVFRSSLLDDGNMGYGVDNIVALLNNGYHAQAYVYGYWDTAGKEIWSRKDRAAEGFMQTAINTFNTDIGIKYGCTAKLSEKYEY